MSRKTILHIGDPLLRAVSHPVTKFDLRLQMIARDMGETMYAADGIGLAAPQIGLMRRLIVIDVYDEQGLRVFVNPQIIKAEGDVAMEEGCLSIPGRSGVVTRPNHVKVQAQDADGNAIELEAEEFFARAVCHELDHLDGVLYVDKMDREILEGDEEYEPVDGDEEEDGE